MLFIEEGGDNAEITLFVTLRLQAFSIINAGKLSSTAAEAKIPPLDTPRHLLFALLLIDAILFHYFQFHMNQADPSKNL